MLKTTLFVVTNTIYVGFVFDNLVPFNSTHCQFQIFKLETRPPLKKSGFSGQILITLML